MYKRWFKTLFDKVLALLLLILFAPIWLTVSALIYMNLGSPIFFRQERPGFKGTIFTIYKFRTMREAFDDKGELLSDEARLTKLGKFIRSTSLDELPQLLNILKGDMSFIGPRPLLKEYIPLYNDEQKTRHDVKPGITGWAQVNGRNAISWEAKFEYDVWYVKHYDLALDMKIFWLTLQKVLHRSDISSETSQTMERFEGNK